MKYFVLFLPPFLLLLSFLFICLNMCVHVDLGENEGVDTDIDLNGFTLHLAARQEE